MLYGHGQQGQSRLRGTTASIIWDILVTNGQVCRKVVNRELSVTSVGDRVKSPQGLPGIADVAKPVKAADIEISKEGQDAQCEESSSRTK